MLLITCFKFQLIALIALTITLDFVSSAAELINDTVERQMDPEDGSAKEVKKLVKRSPVPTFKILPSVKIIPNPFKKLPFKKLPFKKLPLKKLPLKKLTFKKLKKLKKKLKILWNAKKLKLLKKVKKPIKLLKLGGLKKPKKLLKLGGLKKPKKLLKPGGFKKFKKPKKLLKPGGLFTVGTAGVGGGDPPSLYSG